MKRLKLGIGKYVFRKGDAANGVYLVLSGSVGIFLPRNGTKDPDFLVKIMNYLAKWVLSAINHAWQRRGQ